MLLGAFALPAQAQDKQEQEIRQLLEQRDQEIKSILGTKNSFTDQQREQLKEKINSIIDFRAMGKIALGPHWNDLSATQRNEFVNVFSDIVRVQSLSDLSAYRSQVTYKTVNVSGDSAYVLTSTVYKDTPMKVEYTLGRDNASWKAHDIILDGVSTAEGYARSFQTVIRKKGFDALMENLYKKRDQVMANNS